jgi:hypothetical protein
MEKKQVWILAAVLAGLFAAMFLTAFFSQGGGRSISGLDPAKRFTARPGTTREKARILTSKRPPAPDSSESATASQSEEESSETADRAPLPVASLSGEESRPEETATDRTIRESGRSASPQESLARLNEALNQELPPQERAALYAAAGPLYAQLDPPDFDRAQQAFDEATALAPTLEARLAVFRQELDMLLRRGAGDVARKRIESMLPESAEGSPPRVELGLMLGQAEESRGDIQQAEAAYRRAWDEALSSATPRQPQAQETLRLIALRLVRIYRASGRDSEAETLVRQIRAWTAQQE